MTIAAKDWLDEDTWPAPDATWLAPSLMVPAIPVKSLLMSLEMRTAVNIPIAKAAMPMIKTPRHVVAVALALKTTLSPKY
jgi:hypothetical protein